VITDIATAWSLNTFWSELKTRYVYFRQTFMFSNWYARLWLLPKRLWSLDITGSILLFSQSFLPWMILLLFLLLARYVPNVAKRSIWEQCKKKYILTTDERPTDLTFGKWPYLREIWSDPLHVWFYGGVFGVGRSNGTISGFAKCKMAAWPPSWKIQMAISPRRIFRFNLCLILGWGFRGRRIKWR